MADEPNNHQAKLPHDDEATDLARHKVSAIYAEEPDAKVEAAEVSNILTPSKHQKFIQDLVSSGKDIAAIQTEWHKYYQSLPEKEKLEVWDEFYSSNTNVRKTAVLTPIQPQAVSKVKNQVIPKPRYKRTPRPKPKPKAVIPTHPASKEPVTPVVSVVSEREAKPKLKAKHHLQSLAFGLVMGLLAVFIFLFGFFNEVIIAPFIQPSRNVSVPVIVGEETVAPTSTPEVIIPKINVEIPVVYNIDTTDENVIENDLEGGVIHFPTTVEPGQIGNAAFFGHSSNNIFNPGKYKFAFVLLHTLVDGDTFYLTYNHTVYVYKVVSHFIVNPNDTAVLGPVSGQTATATLITCDPPGTSINRLIVIGQQISPSISTDVSASPSLSLGSTTPLPGNGPSLWTRVIGSTAGKATIGAVAVLVVIVIFRKASKKEPV